MSNARDKAAAASDRLQARLKRSQTADDEESAEAREKAKLIKEKEVCCFYVVCCDIDCTNRVQKEIKKLQKDQKKEQARRRGDTSILDQVCRLFFMIV